MKNMKVKEMTTLGILSAMAVIVNLLVYFPIVPAVSFLKYDPKDIIIVIGGFIYGPFASFVMSAICSVLEIIFRGGTILDVLMNMISTCAFACVAAIIYKKNHTKKGALIALIIGVFTTTICMIIWNYIITPIYFQIPREAVVAMMLPGIIPFNLLKAGLNAGITLFLYKSVVTILRRTSLVESHEKDHVQNSNLIILGLFITVTIICIVLAMQQII